MWWLTLAPIWFPHWPAWMWTISRIFSVSLSNSQLTRFCESAPPLRFVNQIQNDTMTKCLTFPDSVATNIIVSAVSQRKHPESVQSVTKEKERIFKCHLATNQTFWILNFPVATIFSFPMLDSCQRNSYSNLILHSVNFIGVLIFLRVSNKFHI